jgi:hypothetical protein
MKLCKDCKFYRRASIWPVCAHPDVPPHDLATGEREWADFVRKFGKCGRDARLFEGRNAAPAPVSDDPEITALLDGPRGKAGWYVRTLWRINRWLSR